MTTSISETAFLDRLSELLPGAGGYRERATRVETDRRLREYLAERIDEARAALEGLPGGLEAADAEALGRVDSALGRCTTRLRTEARAVGLFAAPEIESRDLDRLYAYDELLLDGTLSLAERVVTVASTASAAGGTLPGIARTAEQLAHAIERRSDVFHAPAA